MLNQKNYLSNKALTSSMLQHYRKYRTAQPGTMVKGSKREKRGESSHNKGRAGRALRRDEPSGLLPTSLSGSALHACPGLFPDITRVQVGKF